jgi:hypothetical protein
MVPQGLEGVFLVLLVNLQGIGTDEIPRLMLMPGRGASWGTYETAALSTVATLLASHPGFDDCPSIRWYSVALLPRPPATGCDASGIRGSSFVGFAATPLMKTL